MGASPSQVENEVADPDSESDDDEVIKIQHHRRYRVSFHYFFIASTAPYNIQCIWITIIKIILSMWY